MIKLLIVDDEQNTREGLVRFIPWSELGIDQVFVAEDGLDALVVFEKENPGIVLSDVRMPRMNGIELSEIIRGRNPHCKIIFLSGYSDKEYLKSAIKVGAIDYVEKPIVFKQLSEAIVSAVQAYTKEIEKKEQDRVLSEANLIQLLIDPKTKVSDISKVLADRLSVSDRKIQLIVSTILLKWTGETNKNIVISDIYKSMSNKLQDKSIEGIMYKFSENELIFISIINKDGDRDIFINLLEDTIREYSAHDFLFSIGISKWREGKDTVHSTYIEALSAAKTMFFLGYAKVILFETINGNKYMFDDSNYKEFEKNLIQSNEQKAIDFVRTLTQQISRCSGTDIDYVRNIFLNLYLVIFNVSEKRNFVKEADDLFRYPFWNKILELQTIHEIEADLLKEINYFFDAFKDKASYEHKVNEIITFIHRNYSNSNITVTAIAESVHLSLNYMCGMFKKSTGKTINDFIRDIRMENACNLLKNRDIKLYEIVEKVGFTDANYFTRIFKKHIGMTPSAYREKYLL